MDELFYLRSVQHNFFKGYAYMTRVYILWEINHNTLIFPFYGKLTQNTIDVPSICWQPGLDSGVPWRLILLTNPATCWAKKSWSRKR